MDELGGIIHWDGRCCPISREAACRLLLRFLKRLRQINTAAATLTLVARRYRDLGDVVQEMHFVARFPRRARKRMHRIVSDMADEFGAGVAWMRLPLVALETLGPTQPPPGISDPPVGRGGPSA